jgi:ADP-ribose pyrophosphatase YjhB (NUDIX family)
MHQPWILEVCIRYNGQMETPKKNRDPALSEPYCAKCGQRVELGVPAGDERARRICPFCETVFYENPQIIVGSVATRNGAILLCRRAIPPRIGYWTLPAGYMETEESTEEGACREAMEEARAKLTIQHLLAVYSLPHINQVQLLFSALVENADISCGPESKEVRLFPFDEIPWDALAFKTVAWALRYHEKVCRTGSLVPDVRTVQPASVLALD